MGGMDLIFTPVLVRYLIGHLGLSRPMTSTSWTHSNSILQPVIVSSFIPAKVGIKSCRCARECFICTCVWLHVHA